MKKILFKILGMSCTMCVSHVEKSVRSISKISDVHINLVDGTMEIICDQSLNEKEVIQAVIDAGYNAELISNDSDDTIRKHTNQEYQNPFKKRLILSVIITLPLFIATFIIRPQNQINWIIFGSIQLIAALSVMIIGKDFYKHGIKSLINKAPTMDTLISIGTLSSFIYSIVIYFNKICCTNATQSNLYFDSCAMILTLVSLGKYIENKSKNKVSSELLSLINLAPKEVTRITNDSNEVISYNDVKVGDILLIKPGERLGVDAVVIEGLSSFDESAITGESLPVDHIPGDYLLSGVLNQLGVVKVETKTVGDNTTIAKISNLMKKAAMTKAKLTRIIDKISLYFVPTIMIIAIITWIIWFSLTHDFNTSLLHAIAVLVISCPCALGLATPLSIMVGMGVGAKYGILFKSSEALETLCKIKNLVLDKTGTLTTGKIVVKEITPNYCNYQDFLKIVASLESNSEHPLGKAIMKEAKSNNIEIAPIQNFSYEPGLGISGTIDNCKYYLGNFRFIKENCHQQNISEIIMHGDTILYLASNNLFLGYVSLSDEIRYSSLNLLEELKKLNISSYMLTGDNKEAAHNVGSHLKIKEENIKAQCLPQDKEEFIANLCKQHLTAMVGDGINDSPALMKSDIGIAIGSGSEIALESASVVLIKNEPSDILNAISLSKATIKNIYENIFWGLFYNLLCIPIAVGALAFCNIELTPIMAALAMSISSLCVVANSLRLNLWQTINKKNKKNKEQKVMQIILKVGGMKCQHCASHVKKALEDIEGTNQIVINLENGEISLSINEEIVNEQMLQDAIAKAGYEYISIKKI